MGHQAREIDAQQIGVDRRLRAGEVGMGRRGCEGTRSASLDGDVATDGTHLHEGGIGPLAVGEGVEEGANLAPEDDEDPEEAQAVEEGAVGEEAPVAGGIPRVHGC